MDEAMVEALVRDAKEIVERDAIPLLGESPEAWRGAVIITRVYRQLAIEAASHTKNSDDEMTDEGNLAILLGAITGAVRAVLDHPAAAAAMRSRDGA